MDGELEYNAIKLTLFIFIFFSYEKTIYRLPGWKATVDTFSSLWMGPIFSVFKDNFGILWDLLLIKIQVLQIWTNIQKYIVFNVFILF